MFNITSNLPVSVQLLAGNDMSHTCQVGC